MTTYINPLTDFGFKRIFGNREILIAFLNDLLPIEHKIVDLTFKNSEKMGRSEEERKAIFDLSCIDDIGNEFIVELQRAKQIHFQDRALYYTTFPIVEQAQKGIWDFKLSKIFFIGILDFSLPYFDDDRYIRHGQIIDNQSKEVISDTLNFIYIELTKFRKRDKNLADKLEKWLYILSNLSSLDEIPDEFKSDSVIQSVFDIAKYSKLSGDDKYDYERNLKIYRDLVNSFDTLKEEGREEKAIEIAKNCLAKGLDTSMISEITNLSIEEIERLKPII